MPVSNTDKICRFRSEFIASVIGDKQVSFSSFFMLIIYNISLFLCGDIPEK